MKRFYTQKQLDEACRDAHTAQVFMCAYQLTGRGEDQLAGEIMKEAGIRKSHKTDMKTFKEAGFLRADAKKLRELMLD